MDDTPQRTHTPLNFPRTKGSSGGYVADDDSKRYHVTKAGTRGWRLEISELTTTAGVTHTTGQPTTDAGWHDTKAVCVAVATAYSALGDGYQPREHGGRSRWTEAEERVRRDLQPSIGGRVTPAMRAALSVIDADPYGPGVNGRTLDALEHRGLTRINHDHAFPRWYLTDAGRTLLPAAVGASDAIPQNAATTQEQTTMTTPDPAARFEARTNDAGNVMVWDYQLNRAALTLFPSDDSAYTVGLMNRDTRATAVLVDGIAVHKLRLPHERAAFPFAQSNHAVHDGDVLVHGDLVAILIDTAYPVALSVNAKGCPRLEPGHNWLTLAGGRYANAFHVAVKVAQQHRIPLLEPEEPPVQPVDAETDVEPVETPAADASRYSVRVAEPGKLGAYGVWDDALNRFATTGYGEDDAEFWRENMARGTRDTAELIDGIAVHTLDETDGEAAYRWTQCNDQFKSGDVLVFADVAAIMVKAWPCAITVADRGFHAGLAPGASWLTMDDGEYAAAYRVAVKVAQSLGLPLSAPVEGENGDAGSSATGGEQ